MLHSDYRDIGNVTFPTYRSRQKYMHSFDIAEPEMANGYEDYREIVTRLCQAAGYRSGQAHMTVDEKIVQPGMSQRRPGAHVDGCFMTEGYWGHQPGPGWAHYCNRLPYRRMSVIVAASHPGCIAYRGDFDGQPKEDGDLEHIRSQLGEGELLPANIAFLLSPDCVHESLVFDEPTKRSFLRIALPLEAQP